MTQHRLTLPLNAEKAAALHSGDTALLSGAIYTARDAAHQRLVACLQTGEPLPLELHGAVLYYAGPAPTPPGRVCGAIGPTTAGRMDVYTPTLLKAGLAAMIGKGRRNQTVRQAMREHGALYFAALGGAAALLARCVAEMRLIAWPELGAEAIYQLTVRDMPLVLINDLYGRDLYEQVAENQAQNRISSY